MLVLDFTHDNLYGKDSHDCWGAYLGRHWFEVSILECIYCNILVSLWFMCSDLSVSHQIWLYLMRLSCSE